MLLSKSPVYFHLNVQFAIVLAENNSNRNVLVGDDNAMNMCTIFLMPTHGITEYLFRIILERRLIEHLHLFCAYACGFHSIDFEHSMRFTRGISNRTTQYAFANNQLKLRINIRHEQIHHKQNEQSLTPVKVFVY